MPTILTIMLPILILIGIGFVAVRSGLVSGGHVQGVAVFVLNFALPAVLLSALSRQDLTETFNGPYVLAYGAGSLFAFIVVFAVLRFGLRRPVARASIGALGGSASNTGFIGFPVAFLAFGNTALVALPLTMLVENILIIPLAFAIVEWSAGNGAAGWTIARETLLRLLRMPLILAIIAGTALALAGLSLPGPIVTSLDMLAAASAPCALFVVGGTIALLKKTDVAIDIAPITIGKLIVHPLAVALAIFLIPGIPADLAAAGIVLASVSMLTVYPILAQRAGMEGIAAAALIVATGLGLISITIALVLVGA